MGTGQHPEKRGEQPQAMRQAEMRVPPIRHIYGPIIGLAVDREETETEIIFIAHPLEGVIIQLDEEQRKVLVEQLTGGIVQAPSALLLPGS